jgi:lipopolysaccharide export system protein LptC
MAGRRTSLAVTVAKLVLPILALAILSSLFLLGERGGERSGLPWSAAELDALAREMRLGAPRFSTVTEDGAALVVSASQLRPGEGGAVASEVAARLRGRDGLSIDIAAPEGRLDTDAEIVELMGGVTLSSAAGYDLRTDRLIATFDRTRLESPGPVAGTGPPGRLEAGSMTLTALPGIADRHVLVFKDGVRLIYVPMR